MKFLKPTYLLLLLPMLMGSCTMKSGSTGPSGEHPLLILRSEAVPEIRKGLDAFPLMHASYQQARETADQGIEAGITVPVPRDPGGGYTHEKHKQNYREMYNAGLVYQLSGEEKYAIFVRDMLLEYQELYPTLGIHPMKKNQSPGKLFWQGLNESVWLVYSIQAYDCIYEFLEEDQRNRIEEKLFRKMVDFFTVEDSYSFDRVHNHGTWAVAGVGMTGMVLGDTSLVQQALYSTKLDGSGGFLRQIDELFSPDGYYAEGPYYQRYALLPFIVFAKALDNNMPELGIFDYREGVLIKAVHTVLQLTNTNGAFYPFNDAIKEKSWTTPELVLGSNIVYGLTGDENLLELAEIQGRVLISEDGLQVARRISGGAFPAFQRKSMLIRDGSQGDQGGLALMRLGEGKEQSSLVFKFSSQGMGHGHFDRLGFMLYDKGEEIIPDYGAARFLNVAAKEGGRYLPENISWAKQTVAHNTLVLNESSNFDGKLKPAEAHSPHLNYAHLGVDAIKLVSATDSFCYENAILHRTLAFVKHGSRRYLVDLHRVEKEQDVQVDLPVYFNGHILESNFDLNRVEKYEVLGSRNGYQHLLVDARAGKLPSTSSITWMKGKGFYSLSFLASPDTEFLVTSLGANDPDFNLRPQKGMMVRLAPGSSEHFLAVYEIHGSYNPDSEAVLQSEGSVQDLSLQTEGTSTLIKVDLKNGEEMKLLLDGKGNYDINFKK